MTVFPTAGHLTSCAGQCSGNDQSAGKRRSGRTRKGSKWLNEALKDAAMGAILTKDSYLKPNTNDSDLESGTDARSAPS